MAAFALELDPASAPARLVRAKLLLRIGDSETAEPLLASLAAGADGISPDPEAIEVLAGLLLRRGELIEAGRWYARGAELEPGELSWTKARTVVALKQGDDERLARLLKVVAEAEPDNLLVRRKRLQLAERSGDPPQIARWAREVLHIDPRDGGAQRALAESEMAQQNPLQAAPHFELAAELLPDRRGWTVRAAKAWQAAGKPERAVELVAPLAASRPDDGELGQLLQNLSEVED